MSFLSNRVLGMPASKTVAVASKTLELKAAGREIIPMGAGEPDFDTPKHVKEAAKDAIDAGRTKYTSPGGIPELREAIRSKFKRENGLDFEAKEIIVCVGCKQVIFNAMMATINPGDEVILPLPCWVSYPAIAGLFGGVAVYVKTTAENRFKMTPGDLDAAITPDTKWLFINSPSNPTGAVYTKEELLALAEVLERHPNVWVLTDDIYEHLVYDSREFSTIAQVAPSLQDRTLTVNGVSKAYAMTGWRIGYGAGPFELIKAMSKLGAQSVFHATSISQWAAIAALEGPQDFVRDNRARFERRRDLIFEGLENIDSFSSEKPEGAFYLFVSIEKLIGRKSRTGKTIRNDEDFATELLENEGVAVVPGSAFGLGPYIRLSYATSEEMIGTAIERIVRFVNGMSD